MTDPFLMLGLLIFAAVLARPAWRGFQHLAANFPGSPRPPPAYHLPAHVLKVYEDAAKARQNSASIVAAFAGLKRAMAHHDVMARHDSTATVTLGHEDGVKFRLALCADAITYTLHVEDRGDGWHSVKIAGFTVRWPVKPS